MNVRVAITDVRRFRRCRFLMKLIALSGGEPALIPIMLQRKWMNRQEALNSHLNRVRTILDTCHAVIIPGNNFDVPPCAYGQEFIHPETARRLPKTPFNARFETEILMAQYAIEKKMPIVGICGGFQVINVVLGGTLVQHLPDDERVKQGKINHRDLSLKKLSKVLQTSWEKKYDHHIIDGRPSNIYPKTHRIQIESGSTLGRIYSFLFQSSEEIKELSIHHQGCFLENLSPLLRPVAFASDGVVEAAEIRDYPGLGLITQFHWECNVSGIAKPIIDLLIESARPA